MGYKAPETIVICGVASLTARLLGMIVGLMYSNMIIPSPARNAVPKNGVPMMSGGTGKQVGC